MIYKSNLSVSDIRWRFHHSVSRRLGHSMGHDVISDWRDKSDNDPVFGMYKTCGFWTHDEAAILFNVANLIGGRWLDVGAHTGWTSAHLAAAGCSVVAVEPMLWHQAWYARFADNLAWEMKSGAVMPWAGRHDQLADVLSGSPEPQWDGVVIDGDHSGACPRQDALLALERLKPNSIVLLHDAMGGPVWDAVYALKASGYRVRMFFTPHMVACCWRGDFKIPDHVPDPKINWDEIITNHMKGFDWSICE